MSSVSQASGTTASSDPPSSSSTISAASTLSLAARASKIQCEKWREVFRGTALEVKQLADNLLKWVCYEQGATRQHSGTKWTKEEEERLRQAIIQHGGNLEKIMELVGNRTEQAVKAAIKRKIDPELVQRLGVLTTKKRKNTMPQEPSESTQDASKTLSNEQKHATDLHNGTNSPDVDPTKALEGPIADASQIWSWKDSDFQLDDHDFLAILDDDPIELNCYLSAAAIPYPETIRVRDSIRPDEFLREQPSSAPDIVFHMKHGKKSILQLCHEAKVYRPRSPEEGKESVPDSKAETSSVTSHVSVSNNGHTDQIDAPDLENGTVGDEMVNEDRTGGTQDRVTGNREGSTPGLDNSTNTVGEDMPVIEEADKEHQTGLFHVDADQPTNTLSSSDHTHTGVAEEENI